MAGRRRHLLLEGCRRRRAQQHPVAGGAYHWFCAELLRNNYNFLTLLLCTLDHLEAAQAARTTQTQLEQAAAALMLVWR